MLFHILPSPSSYCPMSTSEMVTMPLCHSAGVKGLCEGQWFMYVFCSLCSLVAAVYQVYREGDCGYTGVSFG